VIEFRHRPRFALKALCERGVVFDFRGEHFDGYQAIESRLATLIDCPHASLTKELKDFEVWNSHSQLVGRRRDEPIGGSTWLFSGGFVRRIDTSNDFGSLLARRARGTSVARYTFSQRLAAFGANAKFGHSEITWRFSSRSPGKSAFSLGWLRF
jgi:hypothetical protein